MPGDIEDKRHPDSSSRERTGEFSEETRSLDSFLIAKPHVSEPAPSGSEGDPNDFDD